MSFVKPSLEGVPGTGEGTGVCMHKNGTSFKCVCIVDRWKGAGALSAHAWIRL